MSRGHNQTGRSRRSGRFVMLPHSVIETRAWLALTCVARSAFIELLKLYNGINNGRLAMSSRTLAQRLRTSKDTAARALNELEEKRFIDVMTVGSFATKQRRASEYRVTFRRCDKTYELPSHAYARWSPRRRSDNEDKPVCVEGQMQADGGSQSDKGDHTAS